MADSGSVRVDLVIPGLLNLPLHELPTSTLRQDTPLLHHLLRFASRRVNNQSDFDQVVLDRLGLNQSALPYARALNPAEGERLLFRLVHLKSDLNNAVVYPVDIDENEKNLLINDLSGYFKEDFDVEALSDQTWIMHLHKNRSIQQAPHYLSALGKQVAQYLQQAHSNLDWYRLFNEIQMFLHQHDINRQRQQRGQLLVNSLWCWGGDDYGGESHEDIQWFSDDEQLRSLGRLYSRHGEALSALTDWSGKQPAMVIDLGLLKILKGVEDADPVDYLLQLEQRCLQPLLNRQRRVSLRLYTGGSHNFIYLPWHRFKFWRRASELAQLIAGDLNGAS